MQNYFPKIAHFQIELCHMARGKNINRSMRENLFCGPTASLRSVLVALTLNTVEKQASTLRQGFSDGQNRSQSRSKRQKRNKNRHNSKNGVNIQKASKWPWNSHLHDPKGDITRSGSAPSSPIMKYPWAPSLHTLRRPHRKLLLFLWHHKGLIKPLRGPEFF